MKENKFEKAETRDRASLADYKRVIEHWEDCLNNGQELTDVNTGEKIKDVESELSTVFGNSLFQHELFEDESQEELDDLKERAIKITDKIRGEDKEEEKE